MLAYVVFLYNQSPVMAAIVQIVQITKFIEDRDSRGRVVET